MIATMRLSDSVVLRHHPHMVHYTPYTHSTTHTDDGEPTQLDEIVTDIYTDQGDVDIPIIHTLHPHAVSCARGVSTCSRQVASIGCRCTFCSHPPPIHPISPTNNTQLVFYPHSHHTFCFAY